MRTYTGTLNRSNVPLNGIFVFGSNTQGRHGKGAALVAKTQFGAKYGQAKGIQGKSFAIVTKDLTKSKHPSVSQADIIKQIEHLYAVADKNIGWMFYVVYSGFGTNLNGYSSAELASMFAAPGLSAIPNNIIFEHYFSLLILKNQP